MVNCKIFEDLKVLEFTTAIMGPLTGKYFSDYGATVVRVESSIHPDIIRVSPPFKQGVPRINASAFWTQYNTGKHDLSLDLSRPEGRAVARRLAGWCDLLIQNFTTGVMERMGLSQDELQKINPSLIMVSMTNLGRTGPLAKHPGLGPQLQAVSGLDSLLGWPDGGPNNPHGAIPDILASSFASATIVAALDYRRRTGKGQFIDISQYEVTCSLLAPWLLDRIVNGREGSLVGNRDPCYSPHGVYPCSGTDRWCALVVSSDEEWKSLCKLMGRNELSFDPRYASLQARKEHENELDELIGEWTRAKSADDVMWACQRGGIAAGVVNSPHDLFEDPQLQFRGHFHISDHPLIGAHSVIGQPSILSATPAEIKRSPLLGEHNEEIIKNFLNMDEEQYTKLVVDDVLK